MDHLDNPNYYQQDRPYKEKYICCDCRKCFKRRHITDIGKMENKESPAKCPQCGAETIWVGPKFEPPKSNDKNSWKSIGVMRRIGFAPFFGFANDAVNIPKGPKELKRFLIGLQEKLGSQGTTWMGDGGLTSEQLNLKRELRRRVDAELNRMNSN